MYACACVCVCVGGGGSSFSLISVSPLKPAIVTLLVNDKSGEQRNNTIAVLTKGSSFGVSNFHLGHNQVTPNRSCVFINKELQFVHDRIYFSHAGTCPTPSQDAERHGAVQRRGVASGSRQRGQDKNTGSIV